MSFAISSAFRLPVAIHFPFSLPFARSSPVSLSLAIASYVYCIDDDDGDSDPDGVSELWREEPLVYFGQGRAGRGASLLWLIADEEAVL